MSKIMRVIGYSLPLVVIFILLFFFWRGLSLNPQHLPSALINKPLPKFDLPTVLETNQRFKSEDLKGQVSLINVWASWCMTCRAEHDILMKIAQANEVALYGINYRDKLKAAHEWLTILGNPYELTGVDSDGRVAIDLGVYGTPETFIVDKKGMIRYKHSGNIVQAVWENQLLPLIKQLQKETL